MSKYDYLLAEDGSIKTIQDYHDLYVELCLENGKFYIPVSLPRRCPTLRFDLSKGTQDLWDYLDDCSFKLSEEQIKQWTIKQKEIIESKTNNRISVSNKLLLSLLDNNTICRFCFFSGDNYSPNPQKNIQNLRDSGYIILTHKLTCPTCGQKIAHYTLTPSISIEEHSFETIPSQLRKRICKIFNYTDSYTGIKNPNIKAHIPDHKFPEDRWDSSTPELNSISMSDVKIREKFQLLNAQSNMQKQRFCAECVKSGQRGFPFGIKYYYAGNENWDPNIPTKGKKAEEGCVGCGWYDIEKWRESLNNYLDSVKEEPCD